MSTLLQLYALGEENLLSLDISIVVSQVQARYYMRHDLIVPTASNTRPSKEDIGRKLYWAFIGTRFFKNSLRSPEQGLLKRNRDIIPPKNNLAYKKASKTAKDASRHLLYSFV